MVPPRSTFNVISMAFTVFYDHFLGLDFELLLFLMFCVALDEKGLPYTYIYV